LLEGQFYLPKTYDLIAVFLFAITGAIVAYRKDYDYIGLFALALAVGAGGGIIRDGVFLQQIPVFVTDWRYLAVVLAAGFLVILAGERIMSADPLFIVADAIGLGLYAVVGAQKSVNIGIAVLGAGLIGVINAIGGGLLRDIMSGEEPYVVQSGGQVYTLAAVFGVTVFLALGVGAKLSAQLSALIAIGVAFLSRIIFMIFDVRTHPVRSHAARAIVKRKAHTLKRRKTRP
jgi:uncharacterized membrane protein YeiH